MTNNKKKTTIKNESFYIFLIALESLLMGVGNPIIKFGISSFPFFTYMAIRFLLGCLFLVVIFHQKLRAVFKRAYIKPCILISLFTVASFILGTLSFNYTTAINAGFLFSLPVVFTPFLMRLVSKKHLEKKNIISIILVVVGLYFLCMGGGTFQFGLGELLAIGSSLLIACTLEFSAKYLENMDSIFLATFQAGFTGVVCLLLAILTKEPLLHLSQVPLSSWGAVFYLGIVCTGIGYALQNSALTKIDSTKAALVLCSQPIFTAIASYFILGEILTPAGLIGAVIIIGSILLSSLKAKNTRD